MDAETRNRMAAYEAEIRALRRELARIPSRTPELPVPVYLLTIGSGNLISTFGGNNYYGCNAGAFAVTAVPTAAPAALTDATTDGLTAVILTALNGATSLVWASGFMNPGTGAVTGLNAKFSASTPVISYRTLSLSVTATPGTTAPVYLIAAIA